MTVQFFDGSGGRNEAVGLLERVDMESGEPVLHIRKKDDTMVTVPLSKVRAGKVIPMQPPRPQRSV